jgi:hypothetical protein
MSGVESHGEEGVPGPVGNRYPALQPISFSHLPLHSATRIAHLQLNLVIYRSLYNYSCEQDTSLEEKQIRECKNFYVFLLVY